MLRSDFIIRTVQRASENPEAVVGEIVADPWYEMLNDTDQADFWTQILVLLQKHYDKECALRVGDELDKRTPQSVRNTITANFRFMNHLGNR